MHGCSRDKTTKLKSEIDDAYLNFYGKYVDQTDIPMALVIFILDMNAKLLIIRRRIDITCT